MTLDAVGFVLSIAGVPFLFSTGSLPAMSSSSPLWFGGETDVAVLDGWLSWPSGWSERAKPLDGDLEASAVTFRLHDATGSTGAVDGWPVLTRLATRYAHHVVSTPLAASCTSSATSVTVASGSALGSLPRWVWCEREALRVASRSGDVLSVTRGALGTQAAAHTIDADASRLPEVFADLPWILRRKVVLWAVEQDGTAHAVWVGFAVRAPRLSDDGARFDLPCDALWTVVAQGTVGQPDTLLRPVGFGRNAVSSESTSVPTVGRIGVQYASGARTAYALANDTYRTLGSLAERLRSQTIAVTASVLGTAILYADVRFASGTCTVTLDHSAAFFASLHLFGRNVNASSVPRGARYTAVLSLDGIHRSDYSFVRGASTNVLVASLTGVPSSWATTTTTVGGLTTTVTPVLRAALSKDLWGVLSGVTVTTATADGAMASGVAEILPRKAGVTVPESAWLSDSPGFSVCYRVRCDHWLDGLRYGASTLLQDASTDDFDWTGADIVRRATTGLLVDRDWSFDGAVTFGRVAVECCQLSGCTPVTRSGRLAFAAWGWPDARATPAVALTSAEILGSPTWLTWDEGLANRIKVASDELVIDATDSGSINRYGPGRQLKIDLLGRDTESLTMADPVAFARQVIGRMSLWADPLGVARVRVSLAYLNTLELGALVSVSDWVIPDGTGARGLAAASGVVVAREVTIDQGHGSILVDLILFPRQSYGYAPTAKIASRTSTTRVLIDQTTIHASAGYSGGDDTATFAAGDKVQLVVRNTTSLTTQSLTVASVDTGAHAIVFTSALSVSMQSAIDGGSWVDVRFDHYATPVQATQEDWMYVGDDTTRVIDGTSDPAREIAP